MSNEKASDHRMTVPRRDRMWLVAEIARAQFAVSLLIAGNADYDFPTGVLLRRQLMILNTMQDRSLPSVVDHVIEAVWQGLVTISDGQSLHPMCLITSASFFSELSFADDEIRSIVDVIRLSNAEIGPVQDRVSRLAVRTRRLSSSESIERTNLALSVLISRLLYANDYPFPPVVYYYWLRSDRVNRLLSTAISPTANAEAGIVDELSLSLAQLICHEFEMIDINANHEWLMLTCPLCRARSQGCIVHFSCQCHTTHDCTIQHQLDNQRCLCGRQLEGLSA